MDKFREKIITRGTADCPFQRYSLKRSNAGTIFSTIHWHPEAEILYMTQGAVEVRVDKTTFSLSARQIAFIPPGQIHDIQGILPNSSYNAFVFSLDLLSLPESHFFQKELISPIRSGNLRFPYVLLPSDTPYGNVSEALDRICSLRKDDPHYKRVIFTSMVQLFTAMMDYLVPASSLSLKKSNKILKTCLHYMNQHYANHLTLQEIADQVHLHPNYLCAMFKDYTGQTVFQHLTRIRIEKAAELLRSTDISVSETASACGFESLSFFTKKFKLIIGIAPKEYSLRHK